MFSIMKIRILMKIKTFNTQLEDDDSLQFNQANVEDVEIEEQDDFENEEDLGNNGELGLQSNQNEIDPIVNEDIEMDDAAANFQQQEWHFNSGNNLGNNQLFENGNLQQNSEIQDQKKRFKSVQRKTRKLLKVMLILIMK